MLSFKNIFINHVNTYDVKKDEFSIVWTGQGIQVLVVELGCNPLVVELGCNPCIGEAHSGIRPRSGGQILRDLVSPS